MKNIYPKFKPSTPGGEVGRWYAAIKNPPPGAKPLIPCVDPRTKVPLFTHRDDKAKVQKWINETLAPVLAPALGSESKLETADEWADRFCLHRRATVSSADEDHRIWRRTASPFIGGKAIVHVTQDDIEDIRDDLDAKISAWEKSGKRRGIGLAYHTAQNYWTVITTAMKHASTRIGDRSVRVREAQGNPCVGIRPPRNGPSKRRHWLRPDEVTAYLACEEVPIEWREAVAVGLYLHLRPGELQELRVKDVDLDAGEVRINRAWDTVTNTVKAPKTSEGIRTVTIPETLLPLLERLALDEDPEKLIAPIIAATADNGRAEIFRDQLERLAGVKRPELFEDTPTHERIDFRSIRDTGITWRFLAGDPAHVVQREAGHEKLETTLGYAKEVQNREGRYGDPFPAVPFAGSAEPSRNFGTGYPKNAGESGGSRRRARDSNRTGGTGDRAVTTDAAAPSVQPSHAESPSVQVQASRADLLERLIAAIDAGDTLLEEALRARLAARDHAPEAGKVIPLRRGR